jgi:hypothetical protein
MDNKNDKFIVGKWGIYETIAFQNNDDSASVHCNICPQIVFVKNHTGFDKLSNQKPIYFNWEFDKGKLVIEHTENKTKDNILDDGKYQITYTRVLYTHKKLLNEIALSDSETDKKYVLRR